VLGVVDGLGVGRVGVVDALGDALRDQ